MELVKFYHIIDIMCLSGSLPFFTEGCVNVLNLFYFQFFSFFSFKCYLLSFIVFPKFFISIEYENRCFEFIFHDMVAQIYEFNKTQNAHFKLQFNSMVFVENNAFLAESCHCNECDHKLVCAAFHLRCLME